MGSSSPATPANVFVYGSLLAGDVVNALLNRIPPSSVAVLPHHQRFSIKGRVYPAIIPINDKQVLGKVLLDVTPSELHILDEFEDYEYERSKVNVFLEDGSLELEAYTYIWKNKTDPHLNGEWNFEDWENLHKENFLKMTKEFMEEFKVPDSRTRVATYESFYSGLDAMSQNA